MLLALKIPFRRIRTEGEYPPPLIYGSAYHDYCRKVQIFYPIPLNYLVRSLRRVKYWWDSWRSQPTWIDQQIEKLKREMWEEFYNMTNREKMLNAYQIFKPEKTLWDLVELIHIEMEEGKLEKVICD